MDLRVVVPCEDAAQGEGVAMMERMPEELRELFNTDPIVHSALTYYLRGDAPLEVALIACVGALGAANKDLKGVLSRMMALYPIPVGLDDEVGPVMFDGVRPYRAREIKLP